MFIDFASLSTGKVYNTMIQTVLPRPVAWVLSENDNSTFNVAPFSYFNAISSDPPLLMLSIGKKPDGSLKDTRLNIIERNEFVVHIAHKDQAACVTETSRTLVYGESEIERVDLSLADFDGFRLPRINECRIAFACERYRVEDITQTQAMILGLVKKVYIDDSVVELDELNRLKIFATKVDPIMRLGGDDYGTLGEIITVPRPK